MAEVKRTNAQISEPVTEETFGKSVEYVLYSNESWTLRKEEVKRLETGSMWMSG